jgi:hypothetical protein
MTGGHRQYKMPGRIMAGGYRHYKMKRLHILIQMNGSILVKFGTIDPHTMLWNACEFREKRHGKVVPHNYGCK